MPRGNFISFRQTNFLFYSTDRQLLKIRGIRFDRAFNLIAVRDVILTAMNNLFGHIYIFPFIFCGLEAALLTAARRRCYAPLPLSN